MAHRRLEEEVIDRLGSILMVVNIPSGDNYYPPREVNRLLELGKAYVEGWSNLDNSVTITIRAC
jgi:hypothetical protein